MNIDKIISEVSNQHPYKKVGNRDSYGKYSEGWSDACDILGQRLKKEVPRLERIAYLTALCEYSIWADHVPNGEERIEAFEKELKELNNLSEKLDK